MALEQIAQYIEKGLVFTGASLDAGLAVYHEPLSYLERDHGECTAGTLGLALIGKTGDPGRALDLFQKECGRQHDHCDVKLLAELIGCSPRLAELIDDAEIEGASVAAIISALRSDTLVSLVHDRSARLAL